MIAHHNRDAGAAVSRYRLAWAALVVITVTGCSLSSPTQASLSDEGAAKLRIAGSAEMISGGHDAEETPEGPLAAIAWREYGVDASWDDVVAYFEAELRDRGWEEGGGSSSGPSTQEWDAVAWHTKDRILRIAHRRNTAATATSGTFLTIYRVTLIGQGLPSN